MKNKSVKINLLKSLLLLVTVSLAFPIYADDNSNSDPWLTGPLLAPAGETVPQGHVNIETYMFYTDDYGIYNSRSKITHIPVATSLSPTLDFSYGLTSWMDMDIVAPYYFNSSEGAHSNGIGDMGLGVGFQILKDKPGAWMPSLRLTLQETFPTGSFKNLDPNDNGSDAMGAGAYQTNVSANFQKGFQFGNGKYLSSRLSFSYTLPTYANVSSFNAYGGVANTHGQVKLGSVFTTDLGLEYTLTRHWAPALDIVYTTNQKNNFSGNPGTTSSGLPANMSFESGESLSLAPAMEYNFNEHVGVIAGSWFSVYGHNKPSFVSGVAALNLYF